jgi:L-lactate dehydrogenase complex protein LldG
MTNTGQSQFIGRIEKALKRRNKTARPFPELIQTRPDSDDDRILAGITARTVEKRSALIARLTETGKPLNMVSRAVPNAAAAADAIAEIVAEKESEWGDAKSVVAWNHPLVESLGLARRLAPLDTRVSFPDTFSGRNRIADFQSRSAEALCGITSADYCLAETATLVMKSRPGHPRGVSLLPSIHIAVIRPEQILANLKELYALLKWDPTEQAEGLTDCLTFITGPSKTADIEATLVHGAHGPRELYVLVVG